MMKFVCGTLLVALALAAQGVPEGKLGFSVAAETARAAVKPGEPIVLRLTFRNTSDQAFRLPDRITPAPYDYWYLKLQEETTRKAYTGFSTRPMGAAAMPGEINPELLRAGEVKTAIVAFPEFAFLEGDMDFQAARNVWFPQRLNGTFPLPTGTYDLRVVVRFRAFPNRPNLPQNIQDAQRALENDSNPLWKGGEIVSSSAQIKVSADAVAPDAETIRIISEAQNSGRGRGGRGRGADVR